MPRRAVSPQELSPREGTDRSQVPFRSQCHQTNILANGYMPACGCWSWLFACLFVPGWSCHKVTDRSSLCSNAGVHHTLRFCLKIFEARSAPVPESRANAKRRPALHRRQGGSTFPPSEPSYERKILCIHCMPHDRWKLLASQRAVPSQESLTSWRRSLTPRHPPPTTRR